MYSVSHTNRSDPRNVFSEMFRRGVTTPADGGNPSKPTRREDPRQDESESTEMEDVDHEAPEGENVSRVWKRGHEETEE